MLRSARLLAKTARRLRTRVAEAVVFQPAYFIQQYDYICSRSATVIAAAVAAVVIFYWLNNQYHVIFLQLYIRCSVFSLHSVRVYVKDQQQQTGRVRIWDPFLPSSPPPAQHCPRLCIATSSLLHRNLDGVVVHTFETHLHTHTQTLTPKYSSIKCLCVCYTSIL